MTLWLDSVRFFHAFEIEIQLEAAGCKSATTCGLSNWKIVGC